MGRKRNVERESTTGVLRPEAKPELAKASVETGDVGYDKSGKPTTNPSEMVAEMVKGEYWVTFVGAEPFHPKQHKLNDRMAFIKARRVSKDCFVDYVHFLTTSSEASYRLADNKATFNT